MWDDFSLLTAAVALLAFALLWKSFMDFSALNSQVDQTLSVIAQAVQQLQVHVTALSASPNDAATVQAITDRLKQGTDHLASAIAAAQAAMKQ